MTRYRVGRLKKEKLSTPLKEDSQLFNDVGNIEKQVWRLQIDSQTPASLGQPTSLGKRCSTRSAKRDSLVYLYRLKKWVEYKALLVQCFAQDGTTRSLKSCSFYRF